MSRLFELRSSPELDAPVMIVVLDGWIDAGYAAATALSTIDEHTDMGTVAEFDTDALLDHRARRPTLLIDHGLNAGLTWPSIELKAAADLDGRDTLFLAGAEPDHSWRAFSGAVVDLAHEFGARLVVALGAYPAPAPHTRSPRVVSTATNRELAELVGFLPGRVEVPAGVSAAIEERCADAGLPAVGLWAQVPHYASAMPYPAAAKSLIEALNRVAQVRFDTGSLDTDAADTRTRLDQLVSNSPEHVELVHQLEVQADSFESQPMNPVSGDDLAAELERYLREQGS